MRFKIKGRRWIYTAILMGLLIKFLITGFIVVLTARRNSVNEKDSGSRNLTMPPATYQHHAVWWIPETEAYGAGIFYFHGSEKI